MKINLNTLRKVWVAMPKSKDLYQLKGIKEDYQIYRLLNWTREKGIRRARTDVFPIMGGHTLKVGTIEVSFS